MSACGCCGAPAPPPFRAPPPEQAPDLDHRPGEPARSTLPRWLQRCARCGACAPDLAALPADARPIAGTSEYQAQTSRFQRWAMLVAGTPAEAEALLQAAWQADDLGQDAAPLRLKAAGVWRADGVEASLRLVDVLRRAGAFAAATEALATLPATLDENSSLIADFQRARIEAADRGRHLISSALRPPARRPHVSHGKVEKTGFWSRLLR